MKFRQPGEAREPRVRGLSARERAQQAAIERSLSRHVHLTCGHYLTLDVIKIYAFAVLRDELGTIMIYCEHHDDFYYQVKSKPRKVENIDSPLF